MSSCDEADGTTDACSGDCAAQLTRADFQTGREVRWCPGCGDFSILNQLQKLLPTLGIPRENFVFVSGIGCSSRLPYYVNTYGIHGIHGRAPAIATGVKCANPDLSVWVITGDGDALSIGTNHLIHCMRRNVDLKILLLNNRIYGLTKGQYSPTSEYGKKTKSSPLGTIEQPIRPVQTALAAEATFVARTVFSDPAHLGQVLAAAAAHKGTAFVEILQNCRVFNDGAFDSITDRARRDEERILLEHGKPIRFAGGHKGIGVCNMEPCAVDLDGNGADRPPVLIHDVKSTSPALGALLASLEPPHFPTVLGVFRDLDRPTYNDLLMGQVRSCVTQRGRGDLEKLLHAGTTWEVEQPPAMVEPAERQPPMAVYHLPLDDRPEQIAPSAPPEGVDRRWLRENALWFCRLRWGVVGGLVLTAAASQMPGSMARLGLHLTPGWPLANAAILAAFNALYTVWRPAERPAERGIPVRYHLWLQIIVDLAVLTAVIHFLGSLTTYASFMYLFHIILACIFFRPRESLAVAAVSAGLFVVCLRLESAGLLARATVLENVDAAVLRPVPAVASAFLIWGVIWYLVSRLAEALRERDRQLALTNERLTASSEERARHMLQTTHQLKAPFAAIHAHAQLLTGGYCGDLPERARAVAEKIAARCGHLARQIQEMLQLANLRSESQGAPARADIDLAELTRAAVTRLEPAAGLRGIRFQTDLQPVRVRAAEDYLQMLLDNLLSNAVNYSLDGGLVTVGCTPAAGGAVLSVADQGIGIPADKLTRIFQDYYRTSEAVHHNPSSSGLGLAIVRQAARQADVAVQVESAPGRGTRFVLRIPGAAGAASD